MQLNTPDIEGTDVLRMLLDISQRLERIEHSLGPGRGVDRFERTFFTVPEAAKLLDKQPFTIREHCRLGRLEAEKRACGRGRTSEWIISAEEIERYLNEGLLPDRN